MICRSALCCLFNCRRSCRAESVSLSLRNDAERFDRTDDAANIEIEISN